MTCVVVVNRAGQDSLWPAFREPPPGWTPTGFTGTKDERMAHVASVWTDIRPSAELPCS
jgi:MbtH protein